MKRSLTIVVLLILVWPLFSQCGDKLVEAAIAQSGTDAIYIREFSTRLAKGTVKNPTPVVKYNVYLKAGNIYRFNVMADKESGQEAILQLYFNGELVGSTFDLSNRTDNRKFNFLTQKTGSYQVLITSVDGKSGCIAGVMSLVSDIVAKTDSSAIDKNSELETIYLGIENQLSIVTDKSASDTIVITCDNGVIHQQNGNYYIVPAIDGLATLKVTIRDAAGNTKEEAQSDLLVKRLPLPIASVHGIQGGIISIAALQISEALEINYPVDYESYGYRILDFQIKTDEGDERHIQNSGKNFNVVTRNHLSKLKSDSRLIFDNIRVITQSGQIITLEPLAFIVR